MGSRYAESNLQTQHNFLQLAKNNVDFLYQVLRFSVLFHIIAVMCLPKIMFVFGKALFVLEFFPVIAVLIIYFNMVGQIGKCILGLEFCPA